MNSVAISRRLQRQTWWLFALLLLAPAGASVEPGAYRFDNIDRIVAIGDVHGAYPELLSLLRAAGVVDDASDPSWSGGGTHLVFTGDLIDRGDRGRDVLELLMRLEAEAAAAGGAVHVLLGNHEIMNLTGDLRYVSEGDYAAFAAGGTEPGEIAPAPAEGAAEDAEEKAILSPGYLQRLAAFAPDGRYGRWLLDKPVALAIDDYLFLHGGVSAALASMTLSGINTAAQRDTRIFATGWHALMQAGVLATGDDFDAIMDKTRSLAEVEKAPDEELQDSARQMVDALQGLPFRPDGPVWYRGSSMCHPYAELPVIEPVLEQLEVATAVVGHTPTLSRKITSRLAGRVLRIDTGMNHAFYRGRPAALVIENGEQHALYPDQDAAGILVENNRTWPRPYGLSDADIEEFLRTAEVVEIEDLETGITKPRRLTLEQDGRKLQAVFKTVDTDPGLEQRWNRLGDKADRAVYDIAAYKLDRLLGLEMVPVAVPRTIGDEQGVVQLWIGDTFNENERRERNIPFRGACGLRMQYSMMNIFDMLIYNFDRNLGNILYDRDWKVWLIDHSRAFSSSRRLPEVPDNAQVELTEPLAAALQQVTEDNLAVLEPYLHQRQLRGLARRAELLRRRY